MFKATKEFPFGNTTFMEGQEVPADVVTARMKELGLVHEVQEEIKPKKKTKKKRGRPKKAKTEILTEDSSDVTVNKEAPEDSEASDEFGL